MCVFVCTRVHLVVSYLHPVGVVVQQQHSGAGHLLGLHHGLQVGQQAHVFGHVRRQHLIGENTS